MKQGVFSQGRVRLLLSAGTSCYRARRKGERKRKSVRGCIVGPDIRALSVSIVKKGEKDIPGLTDDSKPRRRAPKTASGIRKLYNIPKDENATVLIKKHVVRRTFKSKKNADAPQRQKAPKIQRLVTDARLRRKKLIKKNRVDAWKKTQAAISEYHTLCHEYFENKRKQKKEHDKQKADKAANKTETKPTPVAATTKATTTKNAKVATKPAETQKNTKAQTGKPLPKGSFIMI
jgi:small subunit ribosomal protein S6e